MIWGIWPAISYRLDFRDREGVGDEFFCLRGIEVFEERRPLRMDRLALSKEEL